MKASYTELDRVKEENYRLRQALQKICDPDRCKWSAAEMFHIAQAALEGKDQ